MEDRLVLHEIPFARLSELFVPLCGLPDAEAQYGCQLWEPPLSTTLYKLLTLPFGTGVLPYNNLERALITDGYSSSAIRGNQAAFCCPRQPSAPAACFQTLIGGHYGKSYYQAGSITLTELSRLAQISRPTAYRYINALKNQGHP